MYRAGRSFIYTDVVLKYIYALPRVEYISPRVTLQSPCALFGASTLENLLHLKIPPISVRELIYVHSFFVDPITRTHK